MDSVPVGKDLGDERRNGGGGGEVCGVDCCFATEGLNRGFGGLVGLVALQ